MNIKFTFNQRNYTADLSRPLDISIPLKEGEENPNCYWAEAPKFETIISGNFIGSVKQGGSVNYQKIYITPHGNGTHTECVGHISKEDETINNALKQFHFIAQLITVRPNEKNGDTIITENILLKKFADLPVEGIIIRTLPNSIGKKTKKYSGTNPPYFDAAALAFLRGKGVHHLLVDLPSVDREQDEGRLAAHKSFWNFPTNPRKASTITELIYVENDIQDGLYLVNLQIISLETDACPSKPVIYSIAAT